MKLCYVAHPLSGDVSANLVRAKRWLRWLIDAWPERAFIAPWITECELFDESDPAQRAAGLARDMAVVRACSELYLVGGRVSAGMQAEADTARGAGLPVRDLTYLGKEPPRTKGSRP